MAAFGVQIVTLQPIGVASAYAFGEQPEVRAWQKMVAWAKPRGFLEDFTTRAVFGFNNPYSATATPRYGYEFWVEVGPEIVPEGDIRIVEFFGGSYAVARCEAQGQPEKNIPETWQQLAAWCKNNNHPLGHHHALEKFLTCPDDVNQPVMDLYCPILEQ
jgi:DNA gyrase inhibitor GyrI